MGCKRNDRASGKLTQENHTTKNNQYDSQPDRRFKRIKRSDNILRRIKNNVYLYIRGNTLSNSLSLSFTLMGYFNSVCPVCFWIIIISEGYG